MKSDTALKRTALNLAAILEDEREADTMKILAYLRDVLDWRDGRREKPSINLVSLPGA